jgi:hypothetical protein
MAIMPPLPVLDEVLERSDRLGRVVHAVMVRMAGHADREASLVDVQIDEVQLGIAGRALLAVFGNGQEV